MILIGLIRIRIQKGKKYTLKNEKRERILCSELVWLDVLNGDLLQFLILNIRTDMMCCKFQHVKITKRMFHVKLQHYKLQ
jgi:hypothetical protein